jgi:3-deoxy-7-phosphoheptulonate synthase
MLIHMRTQASPQQTAAVRQFLQHLGYETVPLPYLGAGVFAALPGEDQPCLPAADPLPRLRRECVAALAIARLEPAAAHALTGRARRPQGSVVRVGGVAIGGEDVVVVAGPCSVECLDQLWATAQGVKAAGAHLLRGGAFKPRTSPYAFQGLGLHGLKLLAEVGGRVGMPVVTEVMSAEDVPLVAAYADMLQVGARNMQNFPLLKRLGAAGKPVLLKRAPSATLDEWLGAAEYLMTRGNDQVVLCERGIRGFDTHTRNTLDLAAVAALRELTHLPVLVDPSHATGRRSLIASTARAALAAGADGVCIEAHIRPDESISDREQAIAPADLAALMPSLAAIARAVGRCLPPPRLQPALVPLSPAEAALTPVP